MSKRHSGFRGASVLTITLALTIGVLAAPDAGARATTPGSIYLLMTDVGGGDPTLVPVRRTLDAMTPATTGMQALLAGPSALEALSTPALSTAIPGSTTLNSVSITSGVATVDLSPEFESGGGSASMLARLAQVVYTLTQFSTVDGVTFEVDGVRRSVFGGEGVIVNVPASRDDFHDQLPAVFVDSPRHGDPVGGVAVRVRGLANTFEGTFQAGIYDGDGRESGRATLMASAGNGFYGTFSALIPYIPGEGRAGSLIVWVESAQNGSRIDVREYPILIGRGAHCLNQPATIVGTFGHDRINGTPGNDVIVGLGGRDRILGLGGHDIICGGRGNDWLFGGPGRDLLAGGEGSDVIRGGRGFDRARGGPGLDVCAAELTKWC